MPLRAASQKQDSDPSLQVQVGERVPRMTRSKKNRSVLVRGDSERSAFVNDVDRQAGRDNFRDNSCGCGVERKLKIRVYLGNPVAVRWPRGLRRWFAKP